MVTKAGVPSNKVVVGVTSYGRSFQMTTPGCYGEMCTFTGPESGAKPGPCTGTAGYISDAEIKQIIASGRVNENFFDPKSHSNILVCELTALFMRFPHPHPPWRRERQRLTLCLDDNDQWASWMDDSVKSTRTDLYKFYSLGGITDWAVDLQEFQPDPVVEGWDVFKLQVKLGSDPYIKGERTGNWTEMHCTDPAVVGQLDFTPDQRWRMLDCDSAWRDAVEVWKTYHKPNRVRFTVSLWDTFHGTQVGHCQTLTDGTNCDHTVLCAEHKGSGPAAYEIMNSLIIIHQVWEHLRRGMPMFGLQIPPPTRQKPNYQNCLECLSWSVLTKQH